MGGIERAASRLRQPEYTGENRCLPCTGANLAIAAVLGLVAGAAVTAATRPAFGAAAGGGLVLAGAALIYLRGYLVPGTPTFTRRYFPDWLLAVFDKADPAPSSIDVEETLVAAGVLHDEVADLVLEPRFAAAWAERMDDVDAERGGLSDADANRLDAVELAALTDLDPDTLDIQRYGEAVVATLDAERIGRWESRAAFVADVAAARELDDWVPRWRSIPLAARSELLGALRLFLECCPDCDAALTLDHDVVRSCCRERDVIAVSCSGCGSRLLEAGFDASVLDAETDAVPSPVETH